MKMKLKDIKNQVLKCKRCQLYETKTKYVFGAGDENADIMFIGEAPGAQEDKEGIPFIGRAGKILDELLSLINLNRGDIFICNILKCRSPQNRNPKPNEIESCKGYLNAQIDAIKPKLICSLGNFATEFIFKKYEIKTEEKRISKHHGKIYTIMTLTGKKKIIPLYHPAVAMYTPEMKEVLLKDIKVLQDELTRD